MLIHQTSIAEIMKSFLRYEVFLKIWSSALLDVRDYCRFEPCIIVRPVPKLYFQMRNMIGVGLGQVCCDIANAELERLSIL